MYRRTHTAHHLCSLSIFPLRHHTTYGFAFILTRILLLGKWPTDAIAHTQKALALPPAALWYIILIQSGFTMKPVDHLFSHSCVKKPGLLFRLQPTYHQQRYINHWRVILLWATETDGAAHAHALTAADRSGHLLCIPCVGRWFRVRLVM